MLEHVVSRLAGSFSSAKITARASNPDQRTFGAPEAMAFDRAGNLYVDDVFNKRIRKITFRT